MIRQDRGGNGHPRWVTSTILRGLLSTILPHRRLRPMTLHIKIWHWNREIFEVTMSGKNGEDSDPGEKMSTPPPAGPVRHL